MKKWTTIEEGAEWLMTQVNTPRPFVREISIWEARLIFKFFFESYCIQRYTFRAKFSVSEAVRWTDLEITQNAGETFYITSEIRARALTALEEGFTYYWFPFSRCRNNLKRLYAQKSREMF